MSFLLFVSPVYVPYKRTLIESLDNQNSCKSGLREPSWENVHLPKHFIVNITTIVII